MHLGALEREDVAPQQLVLLGVVHDDLVLVDEHDARAVLVGALLDEPLQLGDRASFRGERGDTEGQRLGQAAVALAGVLLLRVAQQEQRAGAGQEHRQRDDQREGDDEPSSEAPQHPSTTNLYPTPHTVWIFTEESPSLSRSHATWTSIVRESP